MNPMPKLDTFVAREIPFFDPVAAFQSQARSPFSQLLHSVPGAPSAGRYSFIALDPFDTLVAYKGLIVSSKGTTVGSPFDALQATLHAYAEPTRRGLPPFQGGTAGYFGYELVHHLERIRPRTRDDPVIPDMAVGLYDVVAAVDWLQRRAWILSTGLPEADPTRRHARAHMRAEELQARLVEQQTDPAPAPALRNLRSNRTRSDYLDDVNKAIDYIYDGHIYQANLSQRFEAELPPDSSPYKLFVRMIAVNPVAYAAYLNLRDVTVVSTSPERFLRVSAPAGGRRVETRPIKGTIRRSAAPADDDRLRHGLLGSEKDRAENIMIVDLLRNDLSKVCEDESVTVSDLCAIESFASVHHLVSTVHGRLIPDKDAVDLLKACFPGGSITGAPKVRAMEIIAELEGVSRGPYCGAIGYIGFDGAMDTSIAIRTLSIIGSGSAGVRRTIFPVGGGIVADSDAEAEYEESLLKAQAFFDALSPASSSPTRSGAVP